MIMSMQSPWIHRTAAPLPVLEHGLNMFGGANGNLNSSPCMARMQGIIGGGCDVFFGDDDNNNYGGLLLDGGGSAAAAAAADIGAEGELFVPPLETEESFKTDQRIYNTNYFNNINNMASNKINNSDNIKTENLGGGVEDCFQEDQDQLIMGDWDFDDLMKDVSSIPFLDYQ